MIKNKWIGQKMKGKYDLLIIVFAIGVIFAYHTDHNTDNLPKNKPIFFNRYPASIKKARHHVNIDISYEKSASNNEIELTGKIDISQLKNASALDYKWTLKENATLSKGSLTGVVNVGDTEGVTLGIVITDMNKKVHVRLEAFTQGTSIKIGSVQNFVYDPTTEALVEAEKQEKIFEEKTLSKQELLDKELFAPKKPTLRQ